MICKVSSGTLSLYTLTENLPACVDGVRKISAHVHSLWVIGDKFWLVFVVVC